jgi:hypothetical protein
VNTKLNKRLHNKYKVLRMRFRDQKYKNTKQWIDGYEHNLGLILDTLKNELNDINKDRILQYSNFKTMLWLNIVFMGISIKILEYNPNVIFFSIFAVGVFISILAALVGMLEGKHNAYAIVGRPTKFASLDNNKWVKTQGLLTTIYAYRKAIKYNGINIIKRSKWIRVSKLISVISLGLLLMLGSNILYNEGNVMASDKPVTPTVSTVSTTKSISRANDSAPVKNSASSDSKK